MKIIDLLDMMAKGETLPRYILVDNTRYQYNDGDYLATTEGGDYLFTILFYCRGIDEVCIDEGLLNEEVIITNENILTEKEKEYLKAVIKPFRDEISFIKKESVNWCDRQFIHIGFKDEDSIILKSFKKNTMYKGMELSKKYTLEELGL